MVHLWGTPPVMIIKWCIMFWKLFLALVFVLVLACTHEDKPEEERKGSCPSLTSQALIVFYFRVTPAFQPLCLHEPLKPLSVTQIFTFHTQPHAHTHARTHTHTDTHVSGMRWGHSSVKQRCLLPRVGCGRRKGGGWWGGPCMGDTIGGHVTHIPTLVRTYIRTCSGAHIVT